MGSIDYQKLYLLQDEVLKVIFNTKHEFYFTINENDIMKEKKQK